MATNLVSLEEARQKQSDALVLKNWLSHYHSQPHVDLLEALVSEHQNDFPLRRSEIRIDQLRHQALIQVIDERAQTQMLKSLLEEMRANGSS